MEELLRNFGEFRGSGGVRSSAVKSPVGISADACCLEDLLGKVSHLKDH